MTNCTQNRQIRRQYSITGFGSNFNRVFAICLLALCLHSPIAAATFRVTTKIFEGAELNAAAEHLILFEEGLIYDFPRIDTRYVTVYDPARKEVTLLDRHSQVQTTLPTDDLLKVSAAARAAARTPLQQEQLGLNATVQSSSRVNGYTLRFGGFEYHVTTQRPEDPAIAADFARFADLASRLNIVRRLGPPPFGRMTLNQHLAKNSEVPLETTLTLRRGEESQEFRSTHVLEVLEQINDADRKLIDEARGMLTLYKSVDIGEFK